MELLNKIFLLFLELFGNFDCNTQETAQKTENLSL
jgi:hypothetical protein